jgi:hypothetical protein
MKKDGFGFGENSLNHRFFRMKGYSKFGYGAF